MIIVLFEVTLAAGMKDAYLKMAENLYADLQKEEGFISIERFESIRTPDRMLSLQLWESEEAIDRWRNNMQHRRAMDVGYYKVFENYTLRVLTQIRAYTKYDRGQAPGDVSFKRQAHD